MLRIARDAEFVDNHEGGGGELATALQRLSMRRLRVNRMMFRGQAYQY